MFSVWCLVIRSCWLEPRSICTTSRRVRDTFVVPVCEKNIYFQINSDNAAAQETDLLKENLNDKQKKIRVAEIARHRASVAKWKTMALPIEFTREEEEKKSNKRGPEKAKK